MGRIEIGDVQDDGIVDRGEADAGVEIARIVWIGGEVSPCFRRPPDILEGQADRAFRHLHAGAVPRVPIREVGHLFCIGAGCTGAVGAAGCLGRESRGRLDVHPRPVVETHLVVSAGFFRLAFAGLAIILIGRIVLRFAPLNADVVIVGCAIQHLQIVISAVRVQIGIGVQCRFAVGARWSIVRILAPDALRILRCQIDCVGCRVSRARATGDMGYA